MSDCGSRLLHPGLAADAIEEGREEAPFPADAGHCPRGLHQSSPDTAIAFGGSAGIPFPALRVLPGHKPHPQAARLALENARKAQGGHSPEHRVETDAAVIRAIA